LAKEPKIRSVKLYPEVERAWNRLGFPNFNYFVNLLIAHKTGIPEQELDKYKREKDDD